MKILNRIAFVFAWYDLWIGFYIDTKNKYIYFLPFFCIGIRIYYGKHNNVKIFLKDKVIEGFNLKIKYKDHD